LEAIGDDDLEAPNIVSDGSDEISEDDIGETVETDEIESSFIEETFDGQEEPDDSMMFAFESGERSFDDDDFE
ncbi:MAG: hypothetical protein IJV76_00765, partial [Clostridia bacterium]|nr:hypothetical protein [Clostridia bacterium]